MNHRIKRIISVTQRPFISRGRPSCLTSVLFALMFAIMCLWFYWRIYIVLPPNRQPRTYDHCEGSSDSSPPIEAQTAIHLGMVLRGSRTVLRALTMLKSVFYYQGRFRDNSADCDLVRRTPHLTCPLRTDLRQTFPIHVHFICDNETSLLLSTSLTDWKLPGFSWTIYDLYKYTPNVAWILNSHNAGTAATVKLVIPCVLPRWVEKIIVVDSDMLLNANLQDLWQQFDLFDRHQAIAMAAEQRSDSSRCDGQPAGSITVSWLMKWSCSSYRCAMIMCLSGVKRCLFDPSGNHQSFFGMNIHSAQRNVTDQTITFHWAVRSTQAFRYGEATSLLF
ncbi:unnamed protein product [Dicrocoelium dendriticum]|nr:unnamed protein product [Dicrocoelium dendriticum]